MGPWFFWDVTQRNNPEERIPKVFAYFSSSNAQAFTYPIPPGAHEKKPSSNFTFILPYIVIDFILKNQQDALIIQIYSVIKLYVFRASSLPIIRSFLL